MAGEYSGLQSRVHEQCPQVIFVHCCDHKLNLVLLWSVSCIKECNFFTLAGFGAFFYSTEALDTEVKKRFPKMASTTWNYNCRLLETVYDEHKIDIINLLTSMTENTNNWSTETIINVSGLILKCQAYYQVISTFFILYFSSLRSFISFSSKKVFVVSFCINKI